MRIFTIVFAAAVLLIALPLAGVVTPPQAPAIFHAGTRLVEVEVVVRAPQSSVPRPPGFRGFLDYYFDSGPPFGPPGPLIQGLTAGDFTLFDNGQRQPISVFRTGATTTAKAGELPSGAVSNRTDSSGQALNGATVVLIDFLNTDLSSQTRDGSFDMTGYVRLGLTTLLHSLKPEDGQLALYSLGEKLHVLQDFTTDPRRLIDAAKSLDQPRRHRSAALNAAMDDFGDLLALEGGGNAAREVHAGMTVRAMQLIVQHLSGVPGRKTLIWLMPAPRVLSPVMAMLRRANITLYPVTLRCSSCFRAAQALAAATGSGRAFFDAKDLPLALHAAEEESRTAYVLGFYPAEEDLDGLYHHITVKLNNPKLNKTYEIRYRTGYLASKIDAPPPSPGLAELSSEALDSTGVGLTGQAAPDFEQPGSYDISLNIDLHDLHLDRKVDNQATRFTGSFDYSVPNPSQKGTVKVGTVRVDLSEQQLASALEQGIRLIVREVQPESGAIRVVVRDRSTGAAGSLRIPLPAPGTGTAAAK